MKTEFTFAYQPIVDMERRAIASYEALVRGTSDESAYSILSVLSQPELLSFDMEARQCAIQLAMQLGLTCNLNLNLQPASLDAFGPIAVDSTVSRALECGICPQRLVLEISETETISNRAHFASRVNQWRAQGVGFSIDDFGAGYSNLNLLADFQPDSIKLDMVLVRDIWHKGPRQAIIRGVVRTCQDLGIDIIAEGIEVLEEYEWLRDEGITLFQGYLFARPRFKALPTATFPNAPSLVDVRPTELTDDARHHLIRATQRGHRAA